MFDNMYVFLIQIVTYPSKFSKYREEYEEKYGIELCVAEEDSGTFGHSVEKQYNKLLILEAIEGIEQVLDRFPSEFWDGLRDQTQIRIIICDNIKDYEGKRAAGITSDLLFEINVYIDSDSISLEDTIAHEMFHVLIAEANQM